MQIYLDSVGCRLNWSEVEQLARQLAAARHVIVAAPEEADIVILNSCAVTAQAERKTRHRVRSLHRDNPTARLAVVGCYATLRPEVAARLPGVSWVISNDEKSQTADILDIGPGASPPQPGEETDSPDTLRTRAFVKVQDGCDNHCTYCIVRSLRGPSRSRTIDDIVSEIQELTEQADCREAILTGASLGAYGRDLGLERGLHTLVDAVLSRTDLPRLRLSSLEPWDLDDAFFELWEDARLCRHIHLPLQAGCNETLRRMARPIRVEAFAKLVRAAKGAVPGLAVTTDILVGFPGENEAAFQRSYEFVEEMAFAKLHVFPYSTRPGTPASKLPAQVPRHLRDERAHRVRRLGARQRRRFRSRFLDRELDVLWEKQWKDGRWTGWTDNYIRVVAHAEKVLYNRITPARLLTPKDRHVEGEVMA